MQLAIVGLGFMGSTHLKAAWSLPGVQLSVVSSNPDKLKGDLSRVSGNLKTTGSHFDFSQIRTYTSFDDVLADPAIDAVDLCLPTIHHEPFAVKALAAGKHVLVEKPMGIDRAACDRMLAAAAKSGKLLMAAQVLRFFPAYDSLKSWVDSGACGEMRLATFRRRCAAPTWAPWLKDKAQSGGGVFDLLIHDIDMALYLFGNPVKVSASGCEDLANGVDVIQGRLYYEGFSVAIMGGWHPGEYPFSMEYTVVGTGGCFDYHSSQPHPNSYPVGQPAAEVVHPHPVDGYRAEIDYFLQCARTGQQPTRCLPSDSAHAVSLAYLMLESRSRQGENITCQF
jgi:predicted dehydrogenase